jgi:L-ribulose-5-phosphate 4-epimerase
MGGMDDDARLRQELLQVAREAAALGLVQHSQGNFSARLPDTDRVLITPSGIPWARLEATDIVTVDLHGHLVQGDREPSSELAVHLLCYRRRSDIGACAHVEPPYVNTLAVAGLSVPNVSNAFVQLFGGRGLASIPARVSGTAAFAEEVVAALQGHLGVIWKNHGLFCVGRDLGLALDRCVAAEQAARVTWQALAIGGRGPDLVPEEVQVALIEHAARLGREGAL